MRTMAKLTKVFLAVALLALLYNSLQVQGRSAAYDASMKWAPVSRALDAFPRAVHPDGISFKHCDRCTCCAGVICQTMNCCTESTPAPGGGWSTKTLSCDCDSNICV
ncbi:unnamed protein product [Alopecurus aequalis]